MVMKDGSRALGRDETLYYAQPILGMRAIFEDAVAI